MTAKRSEAGTTPRDDVNGVLRLASTIFAIAAITAVTTAFLSLWLYSVGQRDPVDLDHAVSSILIVVSYVIYRVVRGNLPDVGWWRVVRGMALIGAVAFAVASMILVGITVRRL